jgi:hypothetical protein
VRRPTVASRSEAVMVAAGFNPRRTTAHTIGRRVATLEKLDRRPAFNRRYATADACLSENRGLKPTATFISSLRDEVMNESRRGSGPVACAVISPQIAAARASKFNIRKASSTALIVDTLSKKMAWSKQGFEELPSGAGWQWRYLRGIQCVVHATCGLVRPNPELIRTVCLQRGRFGNYFWQLL